MPCFDYEEVECILCEERTVDGYQVFKKKDQEDKVVCDECLEELNKLHKGKR